MEDGQGNTVTYIISGKAAAFPAEVDTQKEAENYLFGPDGIVSDAGATKPNGTADGSD